MEDRYAPDETKQMLYGRAFSFLVPKSRVAAWLTITAQGNDVKIRLGDENELVELVGSSDVGDNDIYTYKAKVPAALQ